MQIIYDTLKATLLALLMLTLFFGFFAACGCTIQKSERTEEYTSDAGKPVTVTLVTENSSLFQPSGDMAQSTQTDHLAMSGPGNSPHAQKQLVAAKYGYGLIALGIILLVVGLKYPLIPWGMGAAIAAGGAGVLFAAQMTMIHWIALIAGVGLLSQSKAVINYLKNRKNQ